MDISPTQDAQALERLEALRRLPQTERGNHTGPTTD